MAVRHLKALYEKALKDYMESKKDLMEFQELASTGMVDPDRVEQYKAGIEPIKQFYQIMSNVMYELNKPNRESKVPAYIRRQEAAVNKFGSTTKLKEISGASTNALKSLKCTES